MAKTEYAGLDYSTGVENRDPETGIHYGVISMNSINLDCTNDFESDYGDPHCPKCGNKVLESSHSDLFPQEEDEPDWFDGQDYVCLDCKECFYSDEVTPDEAIGWHYESDGYKLCDCLDNDIFVLASPYYTFAQFCSPCVPGAGNLDSPCDSGPKSFCLGHDWFDDGKAPYRVFRVVDDVEIEAVEQVVDCTYCNGIGYRSTESLATIRQTTREEVERLIAAGTLKLDGFNPNNHTFHCNVCDTTGKRTEVVEREVTVG